MKKVRTSLKCLHGKLCEHQLTHTLLFTGIPKGETLFNKQETNMLMQWFLTEGSQPKNGSHVCSGITKYMFLNQHLWNNIAVNQSDLRDSLCQLYIYNKG